MAKSESEIKREREREREIVKEDHLADERTNVVVKMVLSSAKYKRHSNESEEQQNLAEVLPSTSANSSIIISGNNLVRRTLP